MLAVTTDGENRRFASFSCVNVHIDTQAGVGQNKPLLAEFPAFFRLPPVNESAATGRYILGQQTHDRRFHEKPEIRFSIETI